LKIQEKGTLYKEVFDLLDTIDIYILDAQALFQLHKTDPPSAVKNLRDGLIKGKYIAIIPTVAIAELLWKCRRKGITNRVERLLEGWKRSPNIVIEPFSLEILELMVGNRDSYELHDEIIAMTCRKYNTKLICTKDKQLTETYNLTKVWD